MASIKNESWTGHSVGDTSPGGWTITGSGFKVQNTTVFSAPNALQFANSGGAGTMMWPTADNYRGYVTVSTIFRFHAVAVEQTWAVIARSTLDFSTCYFIFFEPTGSSSAGIGLFKNIAGTTTQLGSTVGSGAQIALDTWYRVTLVTQGSTINVFVERTTDKKWLNASGVYVSTKTKAIGVTDTDIAANSGYTGFQGSQNAAESQAIFADDFLAATLQAYVNDFTSASGASVGSLAINVPAGTSDGDVLIASVAWSSGSDTITPPGGWTPIRSDTSTGMQLASYSRVAQSEPANYTWNFSGTENTTGAIIDVRSADTATILDGNAANTGTGSVPSAPSVTTTIANDLLLYMGADDGAVGLVPPKDSTPDAGLQNTGGTSELSTGHIPFAGPGATPVDSFIGTVSADWAVHTISVLSTATPPWDGTFGPEQFIQSPDPLAQWRATELVSY